MPKDKGSRIGKPSKAKLAPEAIELVPDAWERFEKAVDKVAKSPPQHRVAKGRTGVAREPKRTKAK